MHAKLLAALRQIKARIVIALSPTPAQIRLNEELNRLRIREEQPIDWACRAATLTESKTAGVLRYFRDQRAVGMPLGEAKWRALRRIDGSAPRFWIGGAK